MQTVTGGDTLATGAPTLDPRAAFTFVAETLLHEGEDPVEAAPDPVPVDEPAELVSGLLEGVEVEQAVRSIESEAATKRAAADRGIDRRATGPSYRPHREEWESSGHPDQGLRGLL